MSSGIKLLERYEKKLVESLAKADIMKLAKDLQRYQVITSQMKKTVASLDHKRLVPQTRARYLLHLVYVRVLVDDTICVKFLAVLGDADSEWVAKMGRALVQLYPIDLALGTGCLVEKELMGKDVGYLMDILVDASHKWEEIGISLKLPIASIEECRNTHNNKLRLRNILIEWVSGEGEPATITHLKEALASKTVGLRRLAGEIEERMRKGIGSTISPAMVDSLQSNTLEILYGSIDTEVRDGKSALLEILVRPRESVSYQWLKDGHPLSEGPNFSGTKNAMLLINHVYQGMEGEYCCHVNHGTESLTSSPMKLSIICQQGKKLLLDKYVKLHEVPLDSWPLVSANTYVELSLVKANKVNTNDFNWYVEREIEDILVTREKVEYEDAFSYERGALVLVEGRPGSGKTTLAHKITKDWAEGRILQNVKMLFLISLRYDQKKSNFFQIFFNTQSRSLQKRIEKSSGDKICFVLDGYDEYSPKHGHKSIIDQLLHKAYLPHAMCIVSSRPVATGELRLQATRRIEILGFTKKQFDMFINQFPFDILVSSEDTSIVKSKLNSYLKACTNVLSMCYLPINACIICFLYSQKLGDNLPKTETEIYENLVIATVLRKLRVKNPFAQLHSLKQLHGKERECFLSLCSLAFDMITGNKQIVHDHNLPMPLDSLNTSPFRGLLTVDISMKLFGLERVLTFLHLTLQEFLAAYHLASLQEDQQMEKIELHSGKDHMLTTFKFYCGLVNMKRKMHQFSGITKVRLDTLYTFHCAFETQEEAVCSKAVEQIDGDIVWSPCVLTPADFTAIGYVISTSTMPVIGLFIPPCLLYEDYADSNEWKNRELDQSDSLSYSFVNTASDNMSLTRLCIKDMFCTRISYKYKPQYIQASQKFKELLGINDGHNVHGYDKLDDTNMVSSDLLSSDSAQPLVNAFRQCSKLQRLRLFGNLKNMKTAKSIVNIFKCSPNLEEVGVFSTMPLPSAIALCSGIRYCKQLYALLLFHTDLSSEGAAVLAESIIHCVNLKILHIPNCNIGLEGTEAIAAGLQHVFLETFNVTSNNIGDKGVVALVHEIRFLRLNASTNNIGSEGTKAFANSLLRNPVLIALQLPKNNLHSNDARALAEGLHCCKNLQDLKLCHNDIGPDGGAVLAEGLRSCTSLEYLQLQNCNLGVDGLMAIAQEFNCWRKLKLLSLSDNGIILDGIATLIAAGLQLLTFVEELYLSNNGMDSSSAAALAEGLQFCPSLHTLDMSKNAIASAGTVALAAGLKCKRMKYVNLSHNNIDIKCVQELSKLLLSSCIHKLDLSHNNINSTGALCLITELISNTRPARLNLLENKISPKATKFLTEMLQRNKDILVLFSSHTSCSS